MIKSFILSLAMLLASTLHAQKATYPQSQAELDSVITTLDAEFWAAYNSCDVDKMATFFTEDIEFYHDMGGLTTGLDQLVSSISQGLCGSNPVRLRRAAVDGTIEIYHIADIGAIIRGTHQFYVVSTEGEYLDGEAEFTHMWRFKDGEWKMSRVYSFDHHQAER
ncbi:MAG: nuclear transport factor 2 family protein [Bacteroidota bacterium]